MGATVGADNGVMRRATALVLTICCGALFGCWLLPLTFLIAGRASFGGGGLPVEFIGFSVIGLISGFGFYTGVRALLAHSTNRTPVEKSPKQTQVGSCA
jgi:hypothetical protein